MHPHSYSGNLVNPQSLQLNQEIEIAFIAMNPKLPAGNNPNENNFNNLQNFNHQNNVLMNPEQFLHSQNNIFINIDNDLDEDGNPRLLRQHTHIFENCDKVLRMLINQDLSRVDGLWYGMLRNHGIIVDWSPFFSHNFNLVGEVNEFARILLEINLNMLSQLNCPIIVIGGDIQNPLQNILDNNEEFDSLEKIFFVSKV